MKRILSFLLCITLSISFLAGCGNNTGSANTTAASQPENQPSIEAPETQQAELSLVPDAASDAAASYVQTSYTLPNSIAAADQMICKGNKLYYAYQKDMLNDWSCNCPVYLATGYTDLRRGIDGLAVIVQQQFNLDPFQNALFLFCGRRRDRIKALYWEGDGFLLLYKRLESGSFQWPRSGDEARELTPQQYRWLMEGLNIDQPKAHKALTGLAII